MTPACLGKNLYFVALVILLVQPAAADHLIVPGQRVGPCRLGGDPDVLKPEWGPPRKSVAESEDPASVPDVYYEYPEWGVWLLVRDYHIAKIGVEGRAWKTAQGFQRFSPVRDVQRNYGQGRVREVKGDGETIRYFLDYPELGISFLVRSKTHVIEAIHIFPPER